jgi:pre-mRNA-splicing factor ATP-dependent RNA helicase DHX16
VAKFQANQRAGRAGRESAGKCFRLYTEGTYARDRLHRYSCAVKAGSCAFCCHAVLPSNVKTSPCSRSSTESFDKLSQAPVPEIQRTNIAQVLLQLKVLGITSPAHFPFLSPPTDVSMRKALELLLIVGALNKVGMPSCVTFSSAQSGVRSVCRP